MSSSAMAAAATERSVPVPVPVPVQAPFPISEAFARDAIIAWFRGEFAAANAIIDALCGHLAGLEGGGGGSEYESVFQAIHRRRLNWIPVLQMQKYYSIADVTTELGRVAERKTTKQVGEVEEEEEEKLATKEASGEELGESSSKDDHSSDREALVEEDTKIPCEELRICSNHVDCELRRANIKITKGFKAKEHVKGHMVNVVKGLKLYEDVFTESELFKLTDYINELRVAGRNGKLSGESFILFNQQLKGNKRELIQFGVPIFGQINEEAKSSIEPIPSVIQTVIDHLVQWHLIPEGRRPNSCIINFFDEGEYSQPYLKPPHLDQPISTLILSESTIAFGRMLVSDRNGNFKGPLMLTLKEGSLLVMRGNSADMAKHVICPSPEKRIILTFCKVRAETYDIQTPTTPPLTNAMTLWQPGVPQLTSTPEEAFGGYESLEVIPRWGAFQAPPLFMLSPMQPMVMNPKRVQRGGGTGVFLPWNVGSKKHIKHLPPRAQRERLLALPSPMETRVMIPTA
ncbi:hypothetical protein Sjap_007714 [Stephania japonica]|uniref:Fe2OG dioxygenase domain-containing protein n=1 Tax=Stephania japonica TaxID=461633 RepID=A0AAP0JP03_9MAGN